MAQPQIQNVKETEANSKALRCNARTNQNAKMQKQKIQQVVGSSRMEQNKNILSRQKGTGNAKAKQCVVKWKAGK